MVRGYRGYVSLNVDVDIDDILNELSHSEKLKLFEYLKDDLDIKDIYDGEEVDIQTVSDIELYGICNKIYENRNSLTNKDRDLLVKLSKKGWYDDVV